MKNRIWLLGLLLIFGVSPAFAQKKEKKKVVIVKEIVDKDGKKTVKKIVKEGDEVDEIELNGKDGHIVIEVEDAGTDNEKTVIIHTDGKDMKMLKGGEMIENINVNVNENDGEKEVEIRIQKKDGEDEVIEWKGSGEIPAEIKEKMEMNNIHIDGMDKDGVFFIEGGHSNNGFLGVQMESEEEDGKMTKGVEISEVIEDSAAEEAGLKKGDVLKKVNGKKIEQMGDVISALDGTKAGDKVDVEYERNGKAGSTTATLKERKNKMMFIEKDMEWNEEDGDRIIIMKGGEDGKKIIKMDKEVIIIKEGGEDDEMEIEIEVEEGSEVEFLQEIDIFPNPTDDILKIRFEANKKDTKVKVTDTSGKEIYSKDLKNFDGTFEEEISLKNAAKGTLILSIEQGKEVFVEKIILR